MPKLTFTIALVLLAILAACGSPADRVLATPTAALFDRSENAPVHQVSGGGELDVAALFPGADKETYGFSATVDGAGNARGQMAINFSDTPPFHLEVTCLAISGNDAWIGGVVTQTHDENVLPVGAQMWVRVRDNGDGASGTPDQMSFFRFAPANSCTLKHPAFLSFNWLHGDITVR